MEGPEAEVVLEAVKVGVVDADVVVENKLIPITDF